MEWNFNNEDIKRHLHELGYKNVPDNKLTMFVSDLRRLIKYEERKKMIDQKLDTLERRGHAETQHNCSKPSKQSRKTKEAILNNGSTSEDDQHAMGSCSTSIQTNQPTLPTSSDFSEEESSLYVDILIPRNVKSVKRSPMEASMLGQIPGVIRCRSSQPHNRSRVGRDPACDPVSLHQQYKKSWQKLNLPGETSHNKLRWAVRGWMMGEEPR